MLKRTMQSAIALAVFCAVLGQAETASEQSALTVSDLVQALGIRWWLVRLPPDMGRNHAVGLAYKHPDGTIESHDRVGGLNAGGTTAKVVVWESEDGNTLRYALLGEAINFRGSLPKKTAMKGSSTLALSQGKTVDAGAVLMKLGQTVWSHDIRPGEIGLILHIEKVD